MTTQDQAPPLPRSQRKHRAVLEAAETLFLRDGYATTTMDEVAERSGVSKQTVYKHFGSKEALFVELVGSMTGRAGDGLHDLDQAPAPDDDVGAWLEQHAHGMLAAVMTPRLLGLRRLVIGEVARFPDLARVLHENGPMRAIRSLAAALADLADRGLVQVDDPLEAATTFNWLVMGAPVNDAMLLGDGSIPSDADLRRHAASATRVFLAAHGPLHEF